MQTLGESSALNGVNSLGLTTTVQPAASAGESFVMIDLQPASSRA